MVQSLGLVSAFFLLPIFYTNSVSLGGHYLLPPDLGLLWVQYAAVKGGGGVVCFLERV